MLMDRWDLGSGHLLEFANLNMAIEAVSFPIINAGSFHGYVNVYQRVSGDHDPWDALGWIQY